MAHVEPPTLPPASTANQSQRARAFGTNWQAGQVDGYLPVTSPTFRRAAYPINTNASFEAHPHIIRQLSQTEINQTNPSNTITKRILLHTHEPY